MLQLVKNCLYFHSCDFITLIFITQGSIASIVNRLCTGQPKNYGSIQGRGKRLLS